MPMKIQWCQSNVSVCVCVCLLLLTLAVPLARVHVVVVNEYMCVSLSLRLQPPWFFVLAACACQRLAVKLEEGNIEDMPAIQMKSHASSDSSKEATEDHETLNGEGYTFTPEMIVWTEGLILNELKWEMHVITPAFFVNPFLQKLSHIRESLYADATKHSSLFLPSIECVEFVLEMARKGSSPTSTYTHTYVSTRRCIESVHDVAYSRGIVPSVRVPFFHLIIPPRSRSQYQVPSVDSCRGCHRCCRRCRTECRVEAVQLRDVGIVGPEGRLAGDHA